MTINETDTRQSTPALDVKKVQLGCLIADLKGAVRVNGRCIAERSIAQDRLREAVRAESLSEMSLRKAHLALERFFYDYSALPAVPHKPAQPFTARRRSEIA